MEWKSLNINRNLITAETDKAVLINMPHISEYDGFCFWHPYRLVRAGRHSEAVSISYTDEFRFRLQKYGKGKYNRRELIKEIEIDVAEFENAFCVVDENITAKDSKNEFETHKPAELTAEKVTVLEELKDD